MKNMTLIISSLVGGAILGSAITCLVKSSSAERFKEVTRDRIIENLKHLHAQIGHVCNCADKPEGEGNNAGTVQTES